MTLAEKLKNYTSVCWYPSAGDDFRPLMYLSTAWAAGHGWTEDRLPDCFVLTSGFGGELNMFLDKTLPHTLFGDARTSLTLTALEELERLDIAHNEELMYDPYQIFYPGQPHDLYENYGRVVCARVHIESRTLGAWDKTLIYAIAENTAFAVEYALPQGLKFDYLYRAHYGYIWCRDRAGSRSNGLFLLKLVRDLGTRYFISDDDFAPTATDPAAEWVYPEVFRTRRYACLAKAFRLAKADRPLTLEDECRHLLHPKRRHPRRPVNRYFEYGLSVWRVLDTDRSFTPLSYSFGFQILECPPICFTRRFKNLRDCAAGIREFADRHGIELGEEVPFAGGASATAEAADSCAADSVGAAEPTPGEFLRFLGRIQSKGIVVIPEWRDTGCFTAEEKDKVVWLSWVDMEEGEALE